MKKLEKFLIPILVILILFNFIFLLKKFGFIRFGKCLSKTQRELIDSYGITLGNPQYSLLIIFGVNDCASCMTEQKFWNRIEGYENVDVCAVGYHEFEDEFWKCVPNYGFDFEVLYDGKALFKNLFAAGVKTPFKLLLKGDKIVYTEGPNMDSISQEAFFQRITEITQ